MDNFSKHYRCLDYEHIVHSQHAEYLIGQHVVDAGRWITNRRLATKRRLTFSVGIVAGLVRALHILATRGCLFMVVLETCVPKSCCSSFMSC